MQCSFTFISAFQSHLPVCTILDVCLIDNMYTSLLSFHTNTISLTSVEQDATSLWRNFTVFKSTRMNFLSFWTVPKALQLCLWRASNWPGQVIDSNIIPITKKVSVQIQMPICWTYPHQYISRRHVFIPSLAHCFETFCKSWFQSMLFLKGFHLLKLQEPFEFHQWFISHYVAIRSMHTFECPLEYISYWSQFVQPVIRLFLVLKVKVFFF